jgi:hypothetical protein
MNTNTQPFFLKFLLIGLVLVALLSASALTEAAPVTRAQEEFTATAPLPVEIPTETLTGEAPADTPTLLTPTETATLPAPTATVTLPVSTDTPTLQEAEPTENLEPTSPPDPYLRPIMVVRTYSASGGSVTPGKDFTLDILLKNAGQSLANNVVATFVSGDLIPRDTGGVIAVGMIHPENHAELSQPLTASRDLTGKNLVTIEMHLTYTDKFGAAFSESFLLTFPVNHPRVSGPVPTQTPTPTPTAGADMRPQLVISSYTTDVSVLQPGYKFNLTLNVKNVGKETAKRVTMIVGGGSENAPRPEETPGPYGTFAASGEFTNFAPLGASNIQSIGDLPPGSQLSPEQFMIVNVSTNPGAYPMKVTFTYLDESGHYFADEQVITLLVYSLPNLEINFYMDMGPVFAGQPNMLPLQVINLGKKSAILGNMRVSSELGEVMNNTVFVGSLETGGYFPLDAMVIPYQPGPLTLTVTVDYTDDFSQAQQVTREISLEVLEAPIYEPGPGEEPGHFPEPGQLGEETFWQKVWRFALGMIGLSSGRQEDQSPGDFPG